jgi:hypothetical protein
MPGWEDQLRTYLWSEGPITTAEERATSGQSTAATATPSAPMARPDASLRIGSLKGTTTT